MKVAGRGCALDRFGSRPGHRHHRTREKGGSGCAVCRAQGGLIADMDLAADMLYGRSQRPSKSAARLRSSRSLRARGVRSASLRRPARTCECHHGFCRQLICTTEVVESNETIGTQSYRNCRSWSGSAGRAQRARLLEEHQGRPLQHHAKSGRTAGIPISTTTPIRRPPTRPTPRSAAGCATGNGIR